MQMQELMVRPSFRAEAIDAVAHALTRKSRSAPVMPAFMARNTGLGRLAMLPSCKPLLQTDMSSSTVLSETFFRPIFEFRLGLASASEVRLKLVSTLIVIDLVGCRRLLGD